MANSISAPLPEATERRLFGRMTFPGKATAVIGMRRAGKTTFLHQIRQEGIQQGMTQQHLPHINFEDERLAGLTTSDLAMLVEEYYQRFPSFRGKEIVTWCFDKIQIVPGWERFVRRLLDSEKVEVFLSRSSAALLSREIATALRGRAWEVVIFPFSAEEYLRQHGHTIRDRLDLLSSHQLLSYLEDCFLIRMVWVEGTSERRRMVHPRKVYSVDPGLIPVVDRSGKANLGHALENAVLIELERRGREVNYVRTRDGFEIDFLAHSSKGDQALVQVCSDLAEPGARQREVRALLSAAEEHPRASLNIVTLMPESAMGILEHMTIHDASLWFLQPFA